MCRINIVIGDIKVRLDRDDCDGKCHTRATNMMRTAASIYMALDVTAEPDAPASNPAGFTAHMELDPERNFEPDLSEWFEESP